MLRLVKYVVNCIYKLLTTQEIAKSFSIDSVRFLMLSMINAHAVSHLLSSEDAVYVGKGINSLLTLTLDNCDPTLCR